MTVHEHDRDLIMDVAEGTLDASAAARARTEIATCDDCAADLAELELALAGLADLAPVTMSEFEASRLTRDLDTALVHVRSVAAQGTPADGKRRISWVPIGSIAAVLLAVVLIAPGLELLGGSSDDAGGDDLSAVALEQEQGGDTAADEASDGGEAAVGALEAPASAEGADERDLESDAAGGAENETSSHALEEAEDAPGDTTTAAASENPTTVPDLSDDLGDLAVDAADAGVRSDELRQKASLDRFLEFAPPTSDDRCFAEAADYIDSPASTYTLGDVTLASSGDRVTITVSQVNDTTVVLAHDPDTCTVVGTTTVD